MGVLLDSCTGDDTLLGSLNVAASIVVLLLLGFVPGVILTSLIFYQRQRRYKRYDIEYRNRYPNTTAETELKFIPVVNALKSANSPTIRYNSGDIRAFSPSKSKLPKTAETLTSGPLAVGYSIMHTSLPSLPPTPSHSNFNPVQSYEQQLYYKGSSATNTKTGNPFATVNKEHANRAQMMAVTQQPANNNDVLYTSNADGLIAAYSPKRHASHITSKHLQESLGPLGDSSIVLGSIAVSPLPSQHTQNPLIRNLSIELPLTTQLAISQQQHGNNITDASKVGKSPRGGRSLFEPMSTEKRGDKNKTPLQRQEGKDFNQGKFASNGDEVVLETPKSQPTTQGLPCLFSAATTTSTACTLAVEGQNAHTTKEDDNDNEEY